jgi:predicted Zn-dependent peptidase
MCGGEAYGVGRMGSLETAESITGEALYDRWKDMLSSAPLYLYYCGSANIDRVEAAFRAAFAGLRHGERSPIPKTLYSDGNTGPVNRVSETMDVTQGKLVLGFRLGRTYRTLEEVARATLFSAVYGGSTNSKLFLNVREKLSLCYFASSSLAMSKGVMLVYSGVEFANFRRAEEEILAQLRACQEGEIAPDELEAARLSAVNSFKAALDAQGRLEEYWLNRFFSGTDFTPEELAEAISKVTLDEVTAVAKDIRLDTIFTLTGKEA